MCTCAINTLHTKFVFLGKGVISQDSNDPMPSCNHEEADTRIVVHVVHALEHGATNIQVRTVDTDVIVILVGRYHELITSTPTADIWVAFGMGKNFCFYSINNICESLGEQ